MQEPSTAPAPQRQPHLSFQLHRLLLEHDLEHVIKGPHIGTHLGVGKQHGYKLLSNEQKSVQLAHLSTLCHLLIEHGVDPRKLPADLFMFEDVLTVLRRSREIRSFVTLYEASESDRDSMPVDHWVAPEDISAHTMLSDWMVREHVEQACSMQTVPFASHASSSAQTDPSRAKALWQHINSTKLATYIYIGSPLVNNLSELFISELLRVQSWERRPDQAYKVPFTFVANKARKAYLPSCCVTYGPQGPALQLTPPGSKQMREIKVVPKQRDAGIVVSYYDERVGTLQIALMGCSSVSTLALGKYATSSHVDALWPTVRHFDKQLVGAWFCDVDTSGDSARVVALEPLQLVPD